MILVLCYSVVTLLLCYTSVVIIVLCLSVVMLVLCHFFLKDYLQKMHLIMLSRSYI